MFRRIHWIAAAVGVCVGTWHASAKGADERKSKLPDNTNSLIKQYRSKLKFSCSSSWSSTWGPEEAFDGNPLRSWFTARGDAAAFGKKPWVAAEFPEDVTVRRVTILSNREPPWQTGYTILVGRLELLDKDGRVLYSWDDEVGGRRPDMEARILKPIMRVRKIRFTSLSDEGDQNPYDDIAIGEILAE